MDNERDPAEKPTAVDEVRRRLTKAGLAAPAVLGALASRPVLGQSLHNCTPSGYISGFASAIPEGVDCTVGLSPSDYAGMEPESWPIGFVDNKKPLDFNLAPSGNPKFADAFEAQVTADAPPGLKNRAATVLEVLRGNAVDNQGDSDDNYTIVAKSGNVDILLGQEAIAACMNAISISDFPISPKGVVDMFNSIYMFGEEQVTEKLTWNKDEVTAYFQSLHD